MKIGEIGILLNRASRKYRHFSFSSVSNRASAQVARCPAAVTGDVFGSRQNSRASRTLTRLQPYVLRSAKLAA
jgi:hypothetical protein